MSNEGHALGILDRHGLFSIAELLALVAVQPKWVFSRNELLASLLEELKIQLIDQGCQKLRDAAKRDYETFVQLIVVATRLGMTFSGEVLEIAGLKKEMVSDEE